MAECPNALGSTLAKSFNKYRYFLYAGTTIIGIFLSLLISAVPGAVYVPSLDTSPSSSKPATPLGVSGSWVVLNSSTPIDAGRLVTGNVTMLKYTSQVSNTSPALYILSPSDWANWAGSGTGSNPSSSVNAKTGVLYDFGYQIAWVRFNFTTTSTAYFYFLVSGNFYGYSLYDNFGESNVRLNVAVHESSISPANTVSTVLVGAPQALILVDEGRKRWKGKPKRSK